MKWISVKDKLPTGTEDVLIYIETNKTYTPIYVGFYDDGIFYSSYEFYECNNCVPLYHVTHWMPLPEIPKEDETK